MSTLQQRIEAASAQFALAVIQAVRGASIDEVLAITSIAPANAARAEANAAAAGSRAARSRNSSRAQGQRRRRSATDIAHGLERVLAIVGTAPDGMRSEVIRAALGGDIASKEMPRILAEGLSSGRLVKSGQKRSTVYALAAAGGPELPIARRANRRRSRAA